MKVFKKILLCLIFVIASIINFTFISLFSFGFPYYICNWLGFPIIGIILGICGVIISIIIIWISIEYISNKEE